MCTSWNQTRQATSDTWSWEMKTKDVVSPRLPDLSDLCGFHDCKLSWKKQSFRRQRNFSKQEKSYDWISDAKQKEAGCVSLLKFGYVIFPSTCHLLVWQKWTAGCGIPRKWELQSPAVLLHTIQLQYKWTASCLLGQSNACSKGTISDQADKEVCFLCLSRDKKLNV